MFPRTLTRFLWVVQQGEALESALEGRCWDVSCELLAHGAECHEARLCTYWLHAQYDVLRVLDVSQLCVKSCTGYSHRLTGRTRNYDGCGRTAATSPSHLWSMERASAHSTGPAFQQGKKPLLVVRVVISLKQTIAM